LVSGPLINNEQVSYVDRDFFKVLDLPLVAGDASICVGRRRPTWS